jgi:hypothetical protein
MEILVLVKKGSLHLESTLIVDLQHAVTILKGQLLISTTTMLVLGKPLLRAMCSSFNRVLVCIFVRPGSVHIVSGIVHDEPSVTGGPFEGTQTWFNAGLDNLGAPTSVRLLSKDVPEVVEEGVTVRVLLGEYRGVNSPHIFPHPVSYLHVKCAPGFSGRVDVPAEFWGMM